MSDLSLQASSQNFSNWYSTFSIASIEFLRNICLKNICFCGPIREIYANLTYHSTIHILIVSDNWNAPTIHSLICIIQSYTTLHHHPPIRYVECTNRTQPDLYYRIGKREHDYKNYLRVHHKMSLYDEPIYKVRVFCLHYTFVLFSPPPPSTHRVITVNLRAN